MLAAVSLLTSHVSLPAGAHAADNFWTGGASNGNFSDNGNWSSPPSWGFGNSLVFKLNTSAPTLTNDLGWRDNNDLFWDTTFPAARTLQSTGDFGLGFKIRLENLSSFTQTVTMKLSGGLNGASQIQLNPVNGGLTLSGTLYNDNGVDYVVFGSQSGTVTNLTLNTPLGPNAPSQTNVDFTVAGGRNTAIQVNAGQVWEGTTDVQSGSLTTANGVTLASKFIQVSGGTVATTSANTLFDLATLTVNSGRLSIGGSDTVGSLAGSGGSVNLAAAATLTAGGLNTNTSYAGSISGSGSFTKVGSGTFTLSGVNTHAGSTSVDNGGLRLDGSLVGSLSVASIASLSGTGTVGGNAVIAGRHSPGTSPGVQTFNADLAYAGGAIVNWELIANNTGTAGTNYDQIVMPTGNLTVSGSTTLALSFNGPGSTVDWSNAFWSVNRAWTVYDLSGGSTSNLSNLILGGSLLDAQGDSLSPTERGYFTTSLSGQDVVLNFTAVPEPSTWAMALAGLAAGGLMIRRRRRSRMGAAG